MRVDSPAGFAPSTDRAVVVPVTVLGVALAAVATEGWLMVTLSNVEVFRAALVWLVSARPT